MKAATGILAMFSVILSTSVITLSTLCTYFPKYWGKNHMVFLLLLSFMCMEFPLDSLFASVTERYWRLLLSLGLETKGHGWGQRVNGHLFLLSFYPLWWQLCRQLEHPLHWCQKQAWDHLLYPPRPVSSIPFNDLNNEQCLMLSSFKPVAREEEPHSQS